MLYNDNQSWSRSQAHPIGWGYKLICSILTDITSARTSWNLTQMSLSWQWSQSHSKWITLKLVKRVAQNPAVFLRVAGELTPDR